MRLYEEHAALYDLAFDWDVGDEVTWLLERFGRGCRSILEPGCGPGRLTAALARRGLDVTGVDRSPAMVDIARRRLRAERLAADVVLADMRDLDLGRRFDGAVCPVNTLAHLPPADLERHLGRIADHLGDGARYLVQLDLREPGAAAFSDVRTWDAAREGTAIRVTWSVGDVHLVARRERHRSRIEVLAGDRLSHVFDR